eukprot:TRINITY_DN1011_c0_g1_i1.p1 TRINITY_DN1011_c0_g1~~TRINITY_DN1011_c0_g1_i1.p1  ORF type:complete len:1234 (-),score=356.79 TRINITY_DN1011_c0_g1_i1:398-4099(-)
MASAPAPSLEMENLDPHAPRDVVLVNNGEGFGVRLHDFGGTHAFAGATHLYERVEVGIMVSAVDPVGEAARNGIHVGDVFLSINGEELSPKKYHAAVELMRKGQELKIRLQPTSEIEPEEAIRASMRGSAMYGSNMMASTDDLRLSMVEVSAADKKVPPPEPLENRVKSLRSKIAKFRWDREEIGTRSKTLCGRFRDWLVYSQWTLPFLTVKVRWVNNAFGSGVAQYFWQLRWLMLVNVSTFLLWLCLVILPWMLHTPLNSAFITWNPSATPQDVSWWHRDDLDTSAITGVFGDDADVAYASWFYYSGYPDIDNWNFSDDSDTYYMDAAYAGCLIGTFVVFFVGVFLRMQRNFMIRKVDPHVEKLAVEQFQTRDIRYDATKHFSTALFGSLDFEMARAKPTGEANIKSILVKVRSLITGVGDRKAVSIKYGAFVEWTPKAGSKPFYVHVTFNSKEQYEDLVSDEGGNEAAVDLWPQHSTYFITRYVITDTKTFEPASAADLKQFAESYDDVYVAESDSFHDKLDSYWVTSKAHFTCMDLIFRNGDYTTEFRPFHRTPLSERAPFEVDSALDTRQITAEGHPIEGFFEILVLGDAPRHPNSNYPRRRLADNKDPVPEEPKPDEVADGKPGKVYSSSELENLPNGTAKDSPSNYSMHEWWKHKKSLVVASGGNADYMTAEMMVEGSWEVYRSAPQNQLPMYKGWRIGDPQGAHIAASEKELLAVFDTEDLDEVAAKILDCRPVDNELPRQPQKLYEIFREKQEQIELGAFADPLEKNFGIKRVYEHDRTSPACSGMLAQATALAKKHHHVSPAYIAMLPYGHRVSFGGRCRKAAGFIGTFLALLLVAGGVFVSIKWEEEITNEFVYGVPFILVFTKNVIPFLVRKCVEFEDWGDPEFMSRQILLRVYVLKMSQLIVLLLQFENDTGIESNNGVDPICTSSTAGMTLYKLIITNGVFAIFHKPIWFGMQKCFYGVRLDFGYDIVSQDYIDLNYSQALFLLGVIYCPMVPPLWCALTLLEFQTCIFAMKKFCRASLKPFATKDANYTMWFFFCTYVVCTIVMGKWLATTPETSPSFCGPFRVSDGARYNAIPNFLSAEAPNWVFTVIEYLINPLLIYALVLVLLTVIGFQYTILGSVRAQTVDEMFTKGLQLRDLIQSQREKFDLQRRSEREMASHSQFQESFVEGIMQAAEDLGMVSDDTQAKHISHIADKIAEHGSYNPELRAAVLQYKVDRSKK